MEMETAGMYYLADILGLRDPDVLGRAFGPDEDDPSEPPLVTVLSHGLWQRRFGGDAAAVGRSITLNGKRLEIVGVAPAGFEGLGGGRALWVPMAASGELHDARQVSTVMSS